MKVENLHTFSLCIFSLIIISSKTCRGAEYQYKACATMNCGYGPNISFPFSLPYQEPDCGYPGFSIDCRNGFPLLQLSENDYIIEDIFYHNQSLRVFNAAARSISLSSNESYEIINCSERSISNTTLPDGRFDYFVGENLLLFYGCRNVRDELLRYELSCNSSIERSGKTNLAMFVGNAYLGRATDTCEGSVVARAELNEGERDDELVDVAAILRRGFVMKWTTSDCRSCGQRTTRLNMFFFIGGPTIAALTSCLIAIYVFIRRKRAKVKQEQEKDIERFLKSNGNLAPIRYKYCSIKKMTNSFHEKLGRGGFGNVYKGKFPDGRLVAVKVLNDSNGNGEVFMNEVASISRTSHINIVALLGFCFEGSKRALIYDFMPNGSLEKFIGNNASSSQESGLGWDKLFEIALGIARGLEYLHQGCNTRILHLDIKPQNILLDKDMNPRISDFGLAKLCPNRSSIVSMMGARGTIGYIAPEVFSRNFGEVSYKSDVYSYGMLVLEMAGGKKTIDPRDVDHTSEIYFPNYLYKEVEANAERAILNEEAESQPLKRNMIIVGLWCIQTNPKDRPSMTRVVEMLEGKLGSLEVPPKPYLSSSPRAAPTYSTSEPI
ncbi:LEAF RUST 10 DISEASE-RESISTANCE LOCUS RECEPTOR-LIKE PROTEIN KINASE-like 2.1 [Salvia divinorum]|uniref:LEAF RUST 10 DISEASE-RESISTANCE LOCUS RECEPTOR-LIKE PROTEIN KINASE-like 2.1 n=1 Tax=Salvia divinorum TaxID=28513 RepID=A0ABD1FLN1_SALDI